MKIELQRVHLMPKQLVPCVLYVSDEFGTAQHLCACGCGAKIRTPLGPSEWNVEETKEGPTLRPSVGNWQQPCRSHYWIWRGQVKWSIPWSEKQILAGRQQEQERRAAYFSEQEVNRRQPGETLRTRLKRLFRR